MNTEKHNPFVPQGCLEQKNQSRARFKLVVSIILAVNGIVLVALLMAGCQKEKEPTLLTPSASDSTQASTDFSAQPQLETPSDTAAAPDTNTSAAPTADATGVAPAAGTSPMPPALPPPTSTLTAPAAGTQDYKIVAGDTFSSIAKKNHVTVKALQDANPGVSPTKLQINQTIKIPAPTMAAPTASTAGAPTADAASADAGGTYEVKSGDTLSSIAKKQGVSLRALRAANNLKTDRIKVGDKLKIPAKTTPAPTATTSTVTTVPTTSAAQ